MTPPLGIFGLDVGELVEDAVRALVDLIVPDFGSEWVSALVTWLVALPPVTAGAFPALNDYADQLAAVGFGLLGASFLAGLLQLWAGGTSGATGAEAVRRAAIAAGALALYPTVLESLLVGVNILTAEMVRHPLVVDGLDKAFGESLGIAAVIGGVSLGLAVGAALVLLYFVAALFVLKIGLTALLAVAVIAGALVWGLYPLPHAQWLARAWLSGIVAALAVPVAWACVFAAAALLARDTLVLDGGGQFNRQLSDPLGGLVKPFAAVACFWIAYRAPYFLLGLARTAGLASVIHGRAPASGFPPRTTGDEPEEGASRPRGRKPDPPTPVERFGAFVLKPSASADQADPSAPRGPRPAPHAGGEPGGTESAAPDTPPPPKRRRSAGSPAVESSGAETAPKRSAAKQHGSPADHPASAPRKQRPATRPDAAAPEARGRTTRPVTSAPTRDGAGGPKPPTSGGGAPARRPPRGRDTTGRPHPPPQRQPDPPPVPRPRKGGRPDDPKPRPGA